MDIPTTQTMTKTKAKSTVGFTLLVGTIFLGSAMVAIIAPLYVLKDNDGLKTVMGDGMAPKFSGLTSVVSMTDPFTTGSVWKSANNSAMYYFDGQRRWVFPNTATYISWYPTYGGIKTVTLDQLSSVPIGGNITVRPGTYLVKTNNNTSTYAVEPFKDVTRGPAGTLRVIDSETRAAALYGADWRNRVIDVPSAFFVNYNTGIPISTNKHPAGTLIKYPGQSSYYYIGLDGLKHLVTSTGLTANKFQTKFAVETTITYGTGAQINSFDSSVGSPSYTWVANSGNSQFRYGQIEFKSAVDYNGSGQVSYNTPVKYMLFESLYPISDQTQPYSYNFNNPVWVGWDTPGAIWATKVMRYLISRPATAGLYYIVRVADDKGNTELNTIEKKWGQLSPTPTPTPKPTYPISY